MTPDKRSNKRKSPRHSEQIVKKEKVTKESSSKIGENLFINNSENEDDNDSDDELLFDVKAFTRKATKEVKKSNNKINVFVTKELKDGGENPFVFLFVRWNFWTLKANAMEQTLNRLFKDALPNNHAGKKLFGGTWSVEEREEPYSIISSKKDYHFVSVIKVLKKEFTIAAAVDVITRTIRKFLHNPSFKECYLPALQQTNKTGKLYKIVSESDHEETWDFCKDVEINVSFEHSMDYLLTDKEIWKICRTVFKKTREELYYMNEVTNVMFKDILRKDIQF